MTFSDFLIFAVIALGFLYVARRGGGCSGGSCGRPAPPDKHKADPEPPVLK